MGSWSRPWFLVHFQQQSPDFGDAGPDEADFAFHVAVPPICFMGYRSLFQFLNKSLCQLIHSCVE
jgi:hypothetical protein